MDKCDDKKEDRGVPRPTARLQKQEERKKVPQDLVKDSGEDLQVPDGGWGWLVAFGSLIICVSI